jgi:hypothetical protein
MNRLDSVSFGDTQELAEWFLRRMSMPERYKLMAEKPLLYARLFPEVKAATILDKVAEELALARQEGA